jgi:urea-proton symporter
MYAHSHTTSTSAACSCNGGYTTTTTTSTTSQILKFSEYCTLGFGLFSGVLAIILHQIGLGLGWVYLFMGIAIGSGVIPIAMCVSWKKCSAAGAMAGAFSGQVAAVIAWLIAAKVEKGEITIDTLGGNYPMLSGNLVAILFSGLVCTTVSLIKPQNFDFAQMDTISMVEKVCTC